MLEGLVLALQPLNLALAAVGAFFGTLVGMLPGIGPINAIALLVPLSLALDLPAGSVLILLTTIYYGSQYGNSISTILLNVPGTASATVTALDGYEMTKRGAGGEALAMSAIASFFGGITSVMGLALFAPALAQVAVRFGPAEYFAVMVLAMSMLTSFAGDRPLRAGVSVLIGLALATVGFDPNSAVPRYTGGVLRLLDGFDFVVVTIGLFAVSEVLVSLGRSREHELPATATRIRVPPWSSATGTMARSSAVGFLIGVLPGAGGTIAAFAAYALEKRRRPALGSGELHGVAAPEAANNAAASGAMIPLLTLGVPGSGTTAVLLGALLAIGVDPGPRFLTDHAELFWGLCASMVVGNAVLLVLNLPLVSVFVRILTLPEWVLRTVIVVASVIAVYAVNRSAFDVLLVAGFGALGYALRKGGFPLAPVVLGFVLGGLMESNLRRALAISGGGWDILYSSWTAVALWVLAAVGLFRPLLRRSDRR